MSPSFKAAVRQALGNRLSLQIAFILCGISTALDGVRRRVQSTWHDYDRKKCKKMRYVFHWNSEKLTEEDRWYLNRYLGLSNGLKVAYELKEAFSQWFNEAKENGQGSILQTTKFITRVLSKSRTSQFTRV